MVSVEAVTDVVAVVVVVVEPVRVIETEVEDR